MLDLLSPVVLKNQPREFDEYRATVLAEQGSATAWLAAPDARWVVPESLRQKVADDGRLLPYHGDTVVLPLDRGAVSACRKLQRELRDELHRDLAERLDPATFHVTLHDLSHGPVAANLDENAARCRERFASLATSLTARPELARITLQPTAVYPSVNVSLVLGLLPATDRDFRVIMNAYNLFDDVVHVPYWPRFHVTLDYLRPRSLDTRRLHGALPCPSPEPIHVDLWHLAYQRFDGMNRYTTEFSAADLPRLPPLN